LSFTASFPKLEEEGIFGPCCFLLVFTVQTMCRWALKLLKNFKKAKEGNI
jgi:hypothetical protein